MDKLVERETATRNPLVAAPALAVQFFLIPLAVVGIAVRSISDSGRSWPTTGRRGLPGRSANGGSDRRWPAAYELSRLMGDPKVRGDRTLAPALVKAFDAGERRRSADPAVSGAGHRPAGSAAAGNAVASLTSALEGHRRRSRGSSRSGRWAPRAIPGVGDAAAALRIARQGHPQDGGLRPRRVARRRAAEDAADGAARLRTRRALECGRGARAPRQP